MSEPIPTWNDLEDPASPFYIPPSIQVAPGVFVFQGNKERAVSLLRRCSCLAKYLTRPGIQKDYIETFGFPELAFQLRVFTALVNFCKFTPSDWVEIAQQAGFTGKELDELWLLDLVAVQRRLMHKAPATIEIDPEVTGIERCVN